MVVMLLITIILSVTVPRFDSSFFQDPEKKVTRWIVNTVRDLRSQAIGRQKTYSLVLDLSHGRMWVVNEGMDEEALDQAAENAFSLPEAIRMVDVQMPGRDDVASGTAIINFYPAGYSDQALIHMESDEAARFTYRLQPLLPKVKMVDEWITY